MQDTSSLTTIINDHHVFNDTFSNTTIDLSKLSLSTKETARIIKELLPQWIENGKNNHKHMILLKLVPTQSRIHKYALDAGFVPHHAGPSETVMEHCLSGHSEKECNYPAYKTVSIGVTGVVFNQTLEKFIAIKQIEGPYRDWKAPTAIVETGEEPVHAAVRRLFEETGVQVNAKDAMLVAEGWTPNFRGTAPDINQVFAFRTDEEQCVLKGKEGEIEQITWLTVSDFENMPVKLTHNKPFVIKEIVKVAQRAMQNQSGWQERDFAWGSGKDIRFYS